MSVANNIPKNWVKTTLGEVCDVQSGGTPSTKNNKFWNGDIGWITPKDLSSHKGVFIQKGERSITQTGLNNSSAKLLPKHTILFSSRAPIGYVVIAENKITTNQGFKNLICDEKESHFRYFYYLLKVKANHIEKLSSGSTFSEASASLMKSIEIVIPKDIKEQKAIAKILTAFDDKIALLQAQNKTLETTAQTIFKEWFGKYQIDDVLPEGWRVGTLGEEFKVLMGQSPKGTSYNELGNGKVFFQGRAEFTDRFPKKRLYTTEPKRLANKFDVLVSVRAPVGDVNVASEVCCIGRGLSAVICENKSYALYKIKSLKPIFNLFETEGTVFGSINKGSFSNIEVIIPPMEKLKDFEKIAQFLDNKYFQNAIQIQTLQKTRDTLLPKLMSGQLRVDEFK